MLVDYGHSTQHAAAAYRAYIVANSDAGASLPLVVYRWLGDDGAGAGPVPGHVATVGG